MFVQWQHHTTVLNDRLFNDDALTPEEEAMLDRLERDYLTRIQASKLEDYDYHSIHNKITSMGG
jgi:hypothetical protein